MPDLIVYEGNYKNTGKLQIVKNKDNQFFWRTLAANGKEISRSSETYKNKQGCLRGLMREQYIMFDVRIEDVKSYLHINSL